MSDSMRILVVDDDRRIARTLKDILIISGYSAEEAFSAGDAMEIIMKSPPDCVITDIRMPGMDGVDLFGLIHARQPDLPVIFMTAYASDERINEGVKNGAFGVITKPLEISHLLGFLSDLSKERLVAVVDDDPVFCRTIKDILNQRGYQVKTITDAHRVMDNLTGDVQTVILDMKLNSIDGEDVLNDIRRQYPDMPVVLVTGYRMEMAKAIDEALRLNAYVCLYKPLDIPHLFSTLEKIQKEALQKKL
jgi:two-component system response regulator HydG